jgi:hypothetical protein
MTAFLDSLATPPVVYVDVHVYMPILGKTSLSLAVGVSSQCGKGDSNPHFLRNQILSLEEPSPIYSEIN